MVSEPNQPGTSLISAAQAREMRSALDAARQARIVMIRVFVANGQVSFEMVTPLLNQVMLMWDAETKPATEGVQRQAKNATDVLDGRAPVEAGTYVHAKNYAGEPDYSDAGIHLKHTTKDQILWYSDQPIDFSVEIQRDPELIRLGASSSDRPDQAFNTVAENPFENTFPLYSYNGAPVLSGSLKADDSYRNQKYFKYLVRIEGIKEPLDPHIEGHWD
jgi:hypothetical protein